MGVFDNFLNKFKKPKEEESKEPSKDVDSQLGTTVQPTSSKDELYEQLEQNVEQQNQFIQDLYGGASAQQKNADIAIRYKKMLERRAAKKVDSSVPATSSQEAMDEIEREDVDTRYQEAIIAMGAVLKDTSTMDVSARMKSMEAQKLTFAQIARQARERIDSDLGERSNKKTSSKDGDKPPFDDLFTKAFE